jgi:large subunit ribosomal protein L24
MKINKKLPVKVGDQVKILSGFYKNETGEILKVDRKTGKVVIQGINLKIKHAKPTTENKIGEIKQFEAPIHHSNVKVI